MIIEGHNPIKEVTEIAAHYGCYNGQAIEAKGNGQYSHVWRYIWTDKGLRKPTELESYLFKGK
ncbi:hypothetical protein [Sinomicrobium sp.]